VEIQNTKKVQGGETGRKKKDESSGTIILMSPQHAEFMMEHTLYGRIAWIRPFLAVSIYAYVPAPPYAYTIVSFFLSLRLFVFVHVNFKNLSIYLTNTSTNPYAYTTIFFLAVS
jgi:hypothetical protein